MHVGARHPSPHDAIEVDEVLRGIRRTWKRPKAQKGHPAVTIAYGTSQKTSRLFAGEFLIQPADGPAYEAAGLSYPTKFNLLKTVDLPYTDEWFDVAPGRPFGNSPKLGVLHPSLMRRAQAALSNSKRK
jgi:hypothetical protein